MDDQRFATLYHLVMDLDCRRGKRQQYSDATVLLLLLWSALRRKPRYWACHRGNAPRLLGDGPLPCPSQFSRRLGSADFAQFFHRFLQHLLARQQACLCLLACCLIDAKPLPISRYTKDKEARRGWAAGQLAHGYKLFLYCDSDGRIISYQAHAMNRAEQSVALELLPTAPRPGYTLGDSIYDTQDCHAAAASVDQQLIAPRKDPTGNISARAAGPHRLHSIAMLETPNASRFGVEMYAKRTQIERVFSVMTSATVGMDSLPPWVRTLRRVRLWVDAMIVLYLAFATPLEKYGVTAMMQ